jgi:membrane associated rhomboid family serine protease
LPETPPKSLEPRPADTIRILELELSFARTMVHKTPATIGLLGVMVVVFVALQILATVVASRLDERIVYAHLVVLGAKNNPGIDNGEYWRLGTHMLLHGNAFHLLVNGYALYVLGTVMEKLYGTRRYLILFVVSGLGGALASYLFTESNSVGASGAIFGVLGAAVVFGFKFRWSLPARIRRVLTIGLLPWVAINLGIGLAVEQIDNAAHMGGLFAGGLIALVLGTRLQGRGRSFAVGLQYLIVSTVLCYMAYALCVGLATGAECTASIGALDACFEDLGVLQE